MTTESAATANKPGDTGGDPLRMALRAKEAAKSLGIGERKLWSLTNRGEIPHIRIGRMLRYPVRELEEWISKHTEGGSEK